MSKAMLTLSATTSTLGTRWLLSVSLGDTTHTICTQFNPNKYQAWTQLLLQNAEKAKEARHDGSR